MAKNCIAIIPARGGSKRIPRKNIREFCGKPIIAYSIEAALGSGAFDEVMVSTDDEEIARIAKDYGAKVPFFRSKETSDDHATTRDVLMEVLREYRKHGKEFYEMICIYPTAPFLTSEKIEKAVDFFHNSAGFMLVPVVRFSYPPQRAYIIKNDKLEYKWEEYKLSRSQDLEPFYHDAGQFYIYNLENYYKEDGMIKNNIVPYILPESEVQDIDTEEDWKLAEFKYLLTRGNC